MKAVMYHYIRPDDPFLPEFRHLRVEAFEEQLGYFERNYRLISRGEFLHSMETGVPAPDGVILTFDDGLKDHFTHVLPILRRRGLFGIFYVPAFPYRTGRILDVHRTHLLLGRYGGKLIWEALLPQVSDEMLSHANVSDFRRLTYRNQGNDSCTNHVKRTLNYYIDYKFRTAILDRLMQEFFQEEAQVAQAFYMSKAELREMSEAGMLLGNHTVHHPCMSKLPVERQREEIEDSFTFLDTIAPGNTPRTFCYPYGGFHSFTAETERLLEEARCLFSFNVEQRDITAADLQSRRQALPRYECNLFPPISAPRA